MRLGMQVYALFLILMVGLRYEVGGDWGNYIPILERARDQTLEDGLMPTGDPAYGVLNWIGANIVGGIFFVNLVCATIFSYGLISFVRTSHRPWLAVCVAVPYLVIVVTMGYTRQGVAIGLAMLALAALERGRVFVFGTWIVAAALFHKSALILMPLAVFSGRKTFPNLVGISIAGTLFFLLLLYEHIESLVSGYITEGYGSSGAGTRVAMNALPAMVFLLLRGKMCLTDAQRYFWVWMSVGALAFVVLLVVSPSSTAVDRIALYWIPLQLFVWSRLPETLGRTSATKRQWVLAVVLYSGLVQYTWLNFADNRLSWVPYRFYPWEWVSTGGN